MQSRRRPGVREAVVWIAALSMLVSTLAFPGAAGAVEQYDDPNSETTVPETTVPETTTSESTVPETTTPPEDEEPESTTAAEEQYEGEEEEGSTEGLAPGTEPNTGGSTGGSPEQTTGGTTGGSGPEPQGGSPSGGTEGSTGGTNPTGGGVSVPPPDPNVPPPDPGTEIIVTVVNKPTTVNIIDIDHGVILCGLPNGDRVEIPLNDLDGDGWISYFECYVCICGWLGYRYYDYAPPVVYEHISNVYNTDISNTYRDTGAIRPTPTERVAGLLPDTGGPALLVGGVLLLVVGAIFVGRYTKRA